VAEQLESMRDAPINLDRHGSRPVAYMKGCCMAELGGFLINNNSLLAVFG